MSDKPFTALPKTNKLLGLEIIRFISALAVLIYHYRHFAYVADYQTYYNKNEQPFYALLHVFYDYGDWGVYVFWCISGYIFFWKYREPITEKLIDGKKFFILRFSRLYPLHLATLLLVVVLQMIYFRLNDYYFVYQYNDLPHFALQLFLASNWGFQGGYSFNGPIWSISVEVLAYLVFFLILRFVGKSAAINIFIITLGVAVRFTTISHPIFDCLILFYIGGLSAIASRKIEKLKYRLFVDAVAWCAVCIVPFAIWAFKLYEFDNFMYPIFIIYTPILLFCMSRNVYVNASARNFIEVAGNMTYSSYLLHFPVQLLIAICFTLMKSSIPLYDSTFFVLFVTITLAASYLAYRYFESPAQDIIRQKLL